MKAGEIEIKRMTKQKPDRRRKASRRTIRNMIRRSLMEKIVRSLRKM